MNLEQKIKNKKYDQVWQEYCGFLNFSLKDFMEIQNRLMLEQLQAYSDCELGRHIMKGQKPSSVEEFRDIVPLTQYDDYADILLAKNESALPAKPMRWIKTTREGGRHPIKVVPYTEGMINCHKDISISILLLATSKKKGEFSLRGDENFLYGMATLPYLTGIIPHLISSELPVKFLPSVDEAESMTFEQRNKAGFKLGMQKGIDLFFGLSSIVVKMGDAFSSENNSGKSKINILRNSSKMNLRLMKAWAKSKSTGSPILPKDIWDLKGLICSGTDSHVLKRKIESDWGIKPLEIFAGTEPSCVATESWNKNGLVFIPDACLYEFIPINELEQNIQDPSYKPKTYLLDEIKPNVDYELVISNFKGGAFARYRTGDIFRCLNSSNEEDGINLPHFLFLDREPRFIDIAGFTRISEGTINEALNLANLELHDWFVVKEYGENSKAFLRMYVEIGNDKRRTANKEIIKEHLSTYFKYIDKDYKNLKHFLGMDPLDVTVIPFGTLDTFADTFGRRIRKMNPSHFDVVEVLKIARGRKGVI